MTARALWALVAAHVAPARRARAWIGISLAITAVMGLATPRLGGLIAPLLRAAEAVDEVADPPPAPPRCVDLPTVALQEPPAWLAWPGPVLTAAEAEVLLAFDGARAVHVSELIGPGRADEVTRCLEVLADEWTASERRRAGLSRGDRAVTFTRIERPRPPRPVPAMPDVLPLLVLGIAALNGLGVLAGGLPRWRARGFVETLRATPVSPLTVMAAGLVAGVSVGAALAAVSLLGWLGGMLVGGPPLQVAPHHAFVPVALVPLLALGQRMLVTATDARAAAFRIVGLQMAVGVVAAAWFLAWQLDPLLAAAVPIAGAMGLASGAAATSPGSAALAVGGAAVATAGLVGASARTWLRQPVEAGDPTAWRRARGEFLPEVVVLLGIAVGGQTTWAMPALGAGLAVTLVFGQIGFMAVPALLAPLVLVLPTRPLLALARPRARSLLLAPLVVGLTVALAVAALALAQQGTSPVQSEALERLSRMVGDLGSGPGVLLLTLLPAVCEELLFRGALLGLLLPGRRRWVAVLLQALAFGLMHGMALRFPPTFAIGVVLGVLRLRTGSLWPGVVVHALHNLVGVMAAAWLAEEALARPGSVAALVVAGAVGLGALLLSAPQRSAAGR